MNDVERRAAVREFVARYENITETTSSEKQIDQKFWNDLLGKVLGVQDISDFIEYQKTVKLKNTCWIDAYIKSTEVLIEQKSKGIDLLKPIKQSDGSLLTPYEQAKRYANELPYSERVRWIVTCNFEKFLVYDRNNPQDEPQEILLENLEEEYYRLNFLVNSNSDATIQNKVSIEACERIGEIYNALLKQYTDPSSEGALKSLNILCVRLVFCLYAEDAGLFGERNMFLDYLREFDARRMRGALIDLFKVLDTKEEDRDPYLDEVLAAFPYVNGGLFTDDSIVIPQFTDEIRDLLLKKASSDFDWSLISPTIFGALFESTLNPVTRRSSGMHYTSIENIHKVIDPLFLTDLANELDKIREIKVKKTRKNALLQYQEKLGSLKFLDPACGSGNFLTETYLCLRNLENEVLRELYKGEIVLGDLVDVVKVNINQFYGIEINDFAVAVAKTAMWIAESQMVQKTEDVVHKSFEYLPLKSNANIIEANALRIDWNDVVLRTELNYIISNPPFVGSSLQTKKQKEDILSVYIDENGKTYKTAGKIDYVAGWYFKAASFMVGTKIKTAFVSTNSITQGEQVASVWKPLYERFGIHIDFAYRTFKWESEAIMKAAVHVVIVGFSNVQSEKMKILFYENNVIEQVSNINAYLLPCNDIIIENRKTPICNIPDFANGFKAADNGYLILDEDECKALLLNEPAAKKWIRPYSMGVEFIRKIPRYCLWLAGISPNELQKLPMIKHRVALCKEWRSNAVKTGDAYKLRDVPHLFRPCKQFKDTPYIAIPLVSSENREYVPMGFIYNGMIPGNNLFSVFDAELYHFGILTSNVHMDWMRAVGGRLKSDYRYSKDIVYNNFPWCNPTEAQRAKIEKTAQGILDARALYPDSSLADLYDVTTMPRELRKAHQANDRAVMEAYGFSKNLEESQIVAKLMKMYQELVESKK